MHVLTSATKFSPRKLGVALWIDGNDPLNAAYPANNTSLSSVVNKGISAISFAQGTAGNQAKYITNVFNGNGIIRTDGNDFYASSNSFSLGSSFSIFVVATASSNAAGYYYGTSKAVGGGPTIISRFTNPDPTVRAYEYYNAADRTILATTSTGLNVLEAHQTDAVNLLTRYSGAQISSGVPTVTGATYTINYLLSANSTAPVNFIVDLASVIIATPVLTAAQATDIRKFLADKWAVTIT